MIRSLRRWHRNWKRMIDRETLWESLAEQAPNIEVARAAFRMHMELDGATYGTMTQEEKQAFIELLEWRDELTPEAMNWRVMRTRL